MKYRRPHDKGSLAAELARLPDLDRKELVEKWRKLNGSTPPTNISRSLLLRAVAYKMQEDVYGGLKPATRKFLAQVVEDAKAGKDSVKPSAVIKAGTRLIREWHGRTYEVEITTDGISFQGKRYRSLSEVARVITGTKWSGPLFFGLKDKTYG